ncbi:MAG: hypothetical protein ACTSRU_16240, partial [Candidatus Hodarchaeales archaeon]
LICMVICFSVLVIGLIQGDKICYIVIYSIILGFQFGLLTGYGIHLNSKNVDDNDNDLSRVFELREKHLEIQINNIEQREKMAKEYALTYVRFKKTLDNLTEEEADNVTILTKLSTVMYGPPDSEEGLRKNMEMYLKAINNNMREAINDMMPYLDWKERKYISWAEEKVKEEMEA